MRCAKCVEAGMLSRVYPRGSTSTCMGYQPYYDEAGIYHSHNPNIYTGAWSCSRGHEWTHRSQSPCRAEGCEWNTTRMNEITWSPPKARAVTAESFREEFER